MTTLAPEVHAEEGIIFLSSPIDFQMADEWYEYALADHFWFQWRFRAIRALLRDAAPAEPILEVGCGNGTARAQIEQQYGCRVDGCDVNVAALRQAPTGRGDLYFYDIHQRRGDWAGHFATAVLLDTLEHIPEPVEFLQALAFHLRPGGGLLINVPALQALYSRYDQAAGHVKRYAAATLGRELGEAGFVLEQHAYWGLTLLPVALLRKWVLRFTAPRDTIQTGFQPGSRVVDACLRGLMFVETNLAPLVPLGTSLLALARKDDTP